MKQCITRAYNQIKSRELFSTLIKESSTDRLNNEIAYYNAIQHTEVAPVFCRKFNDYSKDGINYLELEHYAYDDLGKQMIGDVKNLSSLTNYSTPRDKWGEIAGRLDSILEKFSTLTKPCTNVDNERRAMYIDKTEKYYEELALKFPVFSKFEKQDYITVNGKKQLPFCKIWPDIKKHIETTLLKNLPLSVIHGDLCFSNILYSDQGKIVRLIDPRGAFGEVGIFGDPLYDVAKLRHSYQGAYEYIINDAFTVTHKDKEIIFSLSNNNLVDIQLEFERFPRFTSLESKLIEGLIFIGMCSRHYDGPQRQIVMYATGLNILNKIIS